LRTTGITDVLETQNRFQNFSFVTSVDRLPQVKNPCFKRRKCSFLTVL
jgi:hypothetical protein